MPQAATMPGEIGMRQPYASHCWRVHLPGRQPFGVSCVQAATAAEIRAQWPRAVEVEPMHGQEARA